MGNRIKEGKNTLGWDKTICQRFEANQARLTMGLLACNLPVVEALLAKGAEVNAKNQDGDTALTMARERGHTRVVEALKKAGAR